MSPNDRLTGVTPHLMIPDGRAAEAIDLCQSVWRRRGGAIAGA